ncbi:hypothetical protein D3C79_736650 [compost metagenome]
MTIADHPGTTRQRRFDNRFYQLHAGRIQHQHFGFDGRQFAVYTTFEQIAQLFRQRGTARLASKDNVVNAVFAQYIDHGIARGGFPRPFEPFDNHEFTFHSFP